MSHREISEETHRNFHLFWDNFPFPVMLVYKDRTIIDYNTAGETVGYTLGTRCVDMGEKGHHRICQANQALREQTAKRVVGYFEPVGAVLDSYWIPLAGSEDIYLHFATDITEYAGEHMLPKSCGTEGNGCSSCSCG